jgi:alpha-beta hydrolase superfamily lysophospholipase
MSSPSYSLLSYSLNNPNASLIRGVIAQSPAVRTTRPIPAYILSMMSVVSYVPAAGRYTQESELDLSSLKEEEAKEITDNPLLHQMITLRLVRDIVHHQNELEERAKEFKTPVLVAHAFGDTVSI